ncbi:hypothetical protein GIB67_015033 [Kingdonia uniflora]|uniref:Uncharacterized protein n=1 Tax=Kingdonia uniflora TaxID=39325 RepID=A0A7J7MTJ0_9MAGN|nr:hypothetical protein GIB67_015033 [Kingdonia uniflora]
MRGDKSILREGRRNAESKIGEEGKLCSQVAVGTEAGSAGTQSSSWRVKAGATQFYKGKGKVFPKSPKVQQLKVTQCKRQRELGEDDAEDVDEELTEAELEEHARAMAASMAILCGTDPDEAGRWINKTMHRQSDAWAQAFIKAQKMSVQSRGYSTSEIAHGATIAGLALNSLSDSSFKALVRYPRRGIARMKRRCENVELIARSLIRRDVTTGCAYSVYMNLKDLYAQTLSKCLKLGKLNKVVKDQVNTLKCELQEKTENTSHEIDILENEKLGLHDKVVCLEKEVNDTNEKMKSTLDELRLTKLDVVLSEQKLGKFCHGD